MDFEREEKLITYDVISGEHDILTIASIRTNTHEIPDRIDKLREAIECTGLLAQGHISKPGMFIYELLGNIEIDSTTIGYLQQGIDRAVEALASLCKSFMITVT